MKGASAVAVLVALAGPLVVVAAARAAFERLPLEPGAAALGGLVAVGPGGAFGNPALPMSGPGVRARFSWARPFGIPELAESQVELWRPGRWGIAAGARRFGLEHYSETEFRAALSRSGADGGGGVGIRFLEVAGTGWAPRRSVAADIGIRLESPTGSVLGAFAEAVLGEVPGDKKGSGRRTAVGLAQDLGGVRIHVEAQRTEERPPSAVMGVSWAPVAGWHLLAGVRGDPPTWSVGARFPLPDAEVSVGSSWASPLGRTVRIAVVLGSGSGRAAPQPMLSLGMKCSSDCPGGRSPRREN